MKIRLWVLLALIMVLAMPAPVQASTVAPDIQWSKCIGGSGYEGIPSIQQTSDGGYILASSTVSTDGDVTGNHGEMDAWVVKLDASGKLVWNKGLGGTNRDVEEIGRRIYGDI